MARSLPIRFLKDINFKDVSLFGGKGVSLGELLNFKINVPNAFVIGTDITEANLKEYEVQIFKYFDKLKSDYVAVRSSATKEDAMDTSFAGQFDTFLNVNKKQLMGKIRECLKSVHSDKIVSYCASRDIDLKDIKIAVVIQKMVQSEISGIAFSVNPITKDTNQMFIESSFGLGEYIVSGIVTPDKYLIDKKSKKVVEQKINYQEFQLVKHSGKNVHATVLLEKRNAVKLPVRFLPELIDNIFKIENKYKKPVDIEWAIENNVLYITQARPITTLS